MINTNMRHYTYFTFGETNAYGEPELSADTVGTIKISIDIISQGLQNNILYSSATYVGLTNDYVDDTYVINYENKRLKVLYVNSRGRYKEVFMAEM